MFVDGVWGMRSEDLERGWRERHRGERPTYAVCSEVNCWDIIELNGLKNLCVLNQPHNWHPSPSRDRYYIQGCACKVDTETAKKRKRTINHDTQANNQATDDPIKPLWITDWPTLLGIFLITLQRKCQEVRGKKFCLRYDPPKLNRGGKGTTL